MALEKVTGSEPQRQRQQRQPMEPEREPAGRSGPAVRVVMTLPPDVAAQLDALADGPRFNGNRSMATAWCIVLGAEVLADARVRERLFASPYDAMREFRGRA